MFVHMFEQILGVLIGNHLGFPATRGESFGNAHKSYFTTLIQINVLDTY